MIVNCFNRLDQLCVRLAESVLTENQENASRFPHLAEALTFAYAFGFALDHAVAFAFGSSSHEDRLICRRVFHRFDPSEKRAIQDMASNSSQVSARP